MSNSNKIDKLIDLIGEDVIEYKWERKRYYEYAKINARSTKMQAQLQRTQKEIESSTYEGNSSLVHVVLNGKKEVVSININIEEDLSSLDKEMLEDMIMLAFNDACRKAEADKEAKLGKYGQGLSGLM